MRGYVELRCRLQFMTIGRRYEHGSDSLTMTSRVLAVIPARGGSKGIPKKNIRVVGGAPLIAHSIRCAKRVHEIDALVVSTDCEEIAAVAADEGVQVVKRPAALASDEASTESALLHTMDELAKQGRIFDYVIVLEPTSPLRSVSTIKNAIHSIIKSDYESLLAVRESTENIGHLVDGQFIPLVPDAPRRRQLRDKYYIESSTIYAVSATYLRREKTLVSGRWGGIVVPIEEAVDVNIESDLAMVEVLLSEREEI